VTTQAEPKALPIAAFARTVGLSRATIHRRIRDGSLRVVRIGPRLLVLTDNLIVEKAPKAPAEKLARISMMRERLREKRARQTLLDAG